MAVSGLEPLTPDMENSEQACSAQKCPVLGVPTRSVLCSLKFSTRFLGGLCDATPPEVESAMLRGASRAVDILRVVPRVRTRVSATKYLHAVQNRWAGRTSENEGERQRLIMEARELIRASWHASEVEDRAKYYTIILKAQERLAKLHGLDVKKVDVSRNIDILEQREETIALLTAGAETNSIRSILCSIGSSSEIGHQSFIHNDPKMRYREAKSQVTSRGDSVNRWCLACQFSDALLMLSSLSVCFG